jgi:hypothetical protein
LANTSRSSSEHGLVERARRATQQRGAPLEHVLNRRALGAIGHSHPIAHHGTPELTERTQQAAGEIAERCTATREMKAALSFGDDARRHPVRAFEPLELARKELIETERI